jgi:hypothetical protein
MRIYSEGASFFGTASSRSKKPKPAPFFASGSLLLDFLEVIWLRSVSTTRPSDVSALLYIYFDALLGFSDVFLVVSFDFSLAADFGWSTLILMVDSFTVDAP